MIFLSSPYTHPNPEVQKQRVTQVKKLVKECTAAGLHVISPVVYSSASPDFYTPGTIFLSEEAIQAYWRAWSMDILKACNRVVVYMLPGWADSQGVQLELITAQECGIEIKFIDPEEPMNVEIQQQLGDLREAYTP